MLVEQGLITDRGQCDRRGPALSEDIDGRIDRGHVHESPRADADIGEARHVGIQRAHVVGPAIEVFPDAGFESLPRTDGQLADVACVECFGHHGLRGSFYDKVGRLLR